MAINDSERLLSVEKNLLSRKKSLSFAVHDVFAAFERNNSMKLDITRYNSMSKLTDIVTLQRN